MLSRNPDSAVPPSRYSCHECREDSELVMGNRATGEVRALYEHHIRQCRECRRMHRVLYALYEGPQVPAPPNGIREEKQFYSTLRRMKEERPEPWYHKLSIRAGVTALAASAAVLTLSLFDITPSDIDLPGFSDDADALAEASAPEFDGSDGGSTSQMGGALSDDGGIEHPAQSYGRIVGGNARVLPPGGQDSNTNTFPVGTSFQVGQTDSLQVGLAGKIVANFTPGSDVEWVTASPSLLELEVNRGVAAFRYDRKASDPILQIRTPTAVVRVIGTVFTVQVGANNDTIVSVLRGQVEVLDPKLNRVVSEVESGYRFGVGKGTFDDVGKIEVQAALPLSNETSEGSDGMIPASWHVPGLPTDPAVRTLAHVPAHPGTATWRGPSIRVTGTTGSGEEVAPAPVKPPARRAADDGEQILRDLMRSAEVTRKKELHATLELCRTLYTSHETRYRAARCLSSFIEKYGSDRSAAEAYLLLGILRMDYALDYKAAEVAFQTFLRRAPKHPQAEIALYRMWLSSTEDGRISKALSWGKRYLERYPNGRYVGKILVRFPELKSEI